MDAAQERELIEQAGKDKRAFGLLYDAYYDRVFGYILKRTADIQTSQDITSDTFFKALRAINRFHWQGMPFSAWLYRIADHEIANHFRRDGHEHIIAERVTETYALDADNPESEVERLEEELSNRTVFIALHALLYKLPLRYQEVLVLRFFEDKKVAEIGAILGQNQGNVKNLLYRGLAKLQTLLQQGDGAGPAKQIKMEEENYEKLRVV